MSPKNNEKIKPLDGLGLIFTWTQFIYMIRVPIITASAIFLFPLITVYLVPTFFKGLYDLSEYPLLSSFWFSLFTFLLAWTAKITADLVFFYGAERLGLDDGVRVWFRKHIRERYLEKYRLVFIIVAIGAVFTLSGIFWISQYPSDPWEGFYLLSGSMGGAGFALLLLFFADYLQSYFFKPDDAEGLKYMLFPFDSKTLQAAREAPRSSPEKQYEGRKGGILNWIKSNRMLGRGYFCYEEPGEPLQRGHLTAIILFAVFLIVYIFFGIAWYVYGYVSSSLGYENFEISYGIPAIAYLPILAAVMCWGLSAMTYFLDSYRIPLLLPVALGLFITSWGQGHYYQTVPEPAVQNMVSPGETIKAGNENDPSDYIILVAADGGGIQAAAWTARVLTGIEEACRKDESIGFDACGKKIRLISSVSGGSVGAMYFVNSYNAADKGLPADEKELEAIVARAETSSLKNVSWGLAYPDFLNSILPLFSTDRGQELEKAWADNNYLKTGNLSQEQIKAAKQSLRQPLSSWKDGVRAGWRPAVIFNSAVVETGERFLISTTDIAERYSAANGQNNKTSADCRRIAEENIARRENGSRNFYELFPCSDIPIATAARLSASFPYVTPAAKSTIKDSPKPYYNHAHIVDGGYYDNFGIVSLSEWIKELINKPEHPTKILVVQIRSNDTGYDSLGNTTDGWYYQLLAPLKALYNVRVSGQRSRGDLEFEYLQDYAKYQDVTIRSVTFNFALSRQLERAQQKESSEKEYVPPLSWHLTPDEKSKIGKAWNVNLTTENEGWMCFKKILSCYRNSGDCQACKPDKQQ